MRKGIGAMLVTMAMLGCVQDGPTAPSVPETEAQIRMAQLTACYADHHGVRTMVVFTDKAYFPDPNNTNVWATGWAGISNGTIHYYAPDIEKLSPEIMAAVAAHEVCHIALETTNEAKANDCAIQTFRQAAHCTG